tara:strand:+ start:10476 stop:10748 length:273 start_codon:yes stop_codon:yes gene_type:complete
MKLRNFCLLFIFCAVVSVPPVQSGANYQEPTEELAKYKFERVKKRYYRPIPRLLRERLRKMFQGRQKYYLAKSLTFNETMAAKEDNSYYL